MACAETGPTAVRRRAIAAVEAQLRKNGYRVAPASKGSAGDLVVQPAEQTRSFQVKVRGLRKPNGWILPPLPRPIGVFYVLALVPNDAPSRFFVLSEAEATREAEVLRKRLRRPADYVVQGFNFSDGERYEDRWSTLPR
jgi:hypothetical protein